MPKDARGTTLLETLVALLILAIGLVALAQFVAYASANDLRARIRVEMTQLADKRLNEIRFKKFSDLGPPAAFANVYNMPAPATNVLPSQEPEIISGTMSKSYRRWTYIWNPTGSSNPNLRQVVIIVQSASQGFAARETHRVTDYRTNTITGPFYNAGATTP
jgi:type II secretory pathway pseudopilin PulG